MSSTPTVKPGLGHLDAAFTRFILPHLSCWHSLGFTPNALTLLGIVCSALCVVSVYRGSTAPALIFLALRAYFDYADGLLARETGQTSKLGDLLDHVGDLAFMVALFAVVFMTSTHRALHLGVLALFGALFTLQYACIEEQYTEQQRQSQDDVEETSVSRLRALCPADGAHRRALQYTDNAAFYLVAALVVAHMHACAPRKK